MYVHVCLVIITILYCLRRTAYRLVHYTSFTHPFETPIEMNSTNMPQFINFSLHFYDYCQLILIRSALPENHLRTFPAVCHLIHYYEFINLIYRLSRLLDDVFENGSGVAHNRV